MMVRKDGPVSQTSRRTLIGQAALLVLVTALAYFPVLRSGFVWDDDSMLTRNPLVHAADGLYRLWFTTEPTDYWPVTYSSLWLEWRLWGMHAAGYHATNVILHIGEVLLLWGLFRRLRLPGAFLAAVIFALHPVNVESVAWIAQRKNLMAMLFFLLSVLFFVKTLPAALPAEVGFNRWYALSLLAFSVGLLCKGSIALLPVVLLGLVAWRRPLVLRDILTTVPFFLTAAFFVLVDIWFQHHGSAAPIRSAGWIDRILGAGAALDFYLYKAVIPVHLISVYPQWTIAAQNFLWWLPVLAAAGLTVALGCFRYRGTRAALFAWGYFCVMLVPALGFTDVYFMRYSLVADHYQHLALIGVAAFVSASLVWVLNRLPTRFETAGRVLIAATVAGLGVLTWRRCQAYRDSEAFYRTLLEENPSCWMADNNLGGLLLQEGRLPEAVALIDKSLKLEPRYPEAHYNLGLAWFKMGRFAEAIAAYQQALALKPLYPEAHYKLGLAFADSGRTDQASEEYQAALRINPRYAEPHNGLGLLLAGSGQLPEAIAQYRWALSIDPAHADVHQNLGLALFEARQFDEAIAQLKQSIALRPGFADAYNNLGVALGTTQRVAEAAAAFRKAAELSPANPSFRRNLGSALQEEGFKDEARVQFEAADRLAPDPAH